jgi:PhnB protein
MAMTAPGTRSAQPIPEGYTTVTPSIVVKGAADAIAFYIRAFGAEEISRMSMPGSSLIGHAEIKIGNARVMLTDEFPEMGCKGPLTVGGTSSSLHLYVEDADALYQRAVDAGATPTMPLADQFWGDRFGMVTDPFGHNWSIATHQFDFTEAEMAQRMTEACANMQQS